MTDKDGRGSRASALLLIGFILLSYGPALQAGFIWDDDAYVTENEALRSATGLRDIWLDPAATPQYYPAVHTSYWLEYRLFGLEPLGYHLDNILLHALLAILLWRVLLRLGFRHAWFAAAVFALHPVQVESVAWVTERKNVLSGVFYMSAMLFLLRYAPPGKGAASQPEEGGALRDYWLAMLFFVAALLSKTVTASLPAALLVIHWWKSGVLTRQRVTPLLPHFALGIGFGLTTAWLETAHVGARGAEWSLGAIERCLVAGRALWFYAWKLVWPVDLSFVYPRWQIDAGQLWQFVPVLAIVLLAAGLFGFRSRIGRGPLASLLLFAGTLFPALGFLDVYPHRYSYVADHFQYLASAALLVPLASWLADRFERLPGVGSRFAQASLLLVLAGLTGFQTLHYRDPESLWVDTLGKNPDSYLAHTNLGNILLVRGDSRTALAHYREALRIKPEDPLAHNNLAWFLATNADARLRNGDEAVALAERAAALTEHEIPGILDTLAVSQARAGQQRRAMATLDRALAIARAAGLAELTEELEARRRILARGRGFIDPRSEVVDRAPQSR